MIKFCPKCGSRAITNNGSTSECGVLFIADDTGTSLEYASGCSIFSCEECGKDTIIEDDVDFDF